MGLNGKAAKARPTVLYLDRHRVRQFLLRGSVFECVAILDLVRTMELVEEGIDDLEIELEHLGKMLSVLIRFIETNPRK